jgi:hypothetical protein
MAKQLNLDEMLEVVLQIDPQMGQQFQRILEGAGTAMAQHIGEKLGVSNGEATFQGTGFAGTCAPFGPDYYGQECPEALASYDPEGWSTEELSLELEGGQ